ncbi:MAG: hypothetical protein U0132_08045 [Gemmatimonadaceae bacterium]
MSTQRRTLQEAQTSLAVADVLDAAIEFFSRRVSIYTAYVEQQGPTFVTLRGQGGEEIVIAASALPNGTRVTGATYMFDAQVSRFLSTLPAAAEVA